MSIIFFVFLQLYHMTTLIPWVTYVAASARHELWSGFESEYIYIYTKQSVPKALAKSSAY